MSNLMQDLSYSGINPFGVELVAESFLKSPMADLALKNGQAIEINFPVNRKDTPKYCGVKITLTPIQS